MVLCASVPIAPVAPTTERIVEKVKIRWIAPYDNGAAITGYKVYVREQDELTYT